MLFRSPPGPPFKRDRKIVPEKVKVKFDRCNEVEFCSQVGQDIFVLSVLKGKRSGYFVDMGSHDPIFINNTNAHMEDPFEDWYVHPDLVNTNELQELRTEKSTYWKDIILCQKQKGL